jgi:hypothetical protein
METQDDKRERAQSELYRGSQQQNPPFVPTLFVEGERKEIESRFRAREDTCLGEFEKKTEILSLQDCSRWRLRMTKRDGYFVA